MNSNYKTHPDPEYRFFLFDPEWDGLMFFKSEADRAAAAEDAINAYKDLDNGWSEEVERLCMGEVTHLCTQTNVVERPSDEELDEEGCDGEGTYWDPDIELRCDYEMLPIGNTPLVKAQKRLEWAVARKAKVLENIRKSYIQGSNDHHAATIAAQTATEGMGREQALDLLMLLSALESAFLASKAEIPDYLLERIGESVEMLRGEVLA